MQYSANLNHVFLPRAAEFLIVHEAVQKSRWIIISWKVTRKSDSATLWLGLTGSGGRRCVYIGGRNPSCSQFLSRSHHLFFFFFFPNHSLPGGLTGRWKRLFRNNKPWEETMRETTRWQNGRRRRKRDPVRAHGPAHVSIMPTDQRLCLFPSPWWLRPTSDQG